MLVSNLRSRASTLFLRQHKITNTLLGCSQHGLTSAPSFSFAQKLKMDDTMEDVNDIFKQMNSKLASAGHSEASELEPRIVAQKEDVIYIKNPRQSWGFNRVLSIGSDNAKALTLSLQDK